MSFGYDPELPAGLQEADLEMADLIEEGRRYTKLRRGSEIARRSGNLNAAAALCPHGGGYSLSGSIAARNANDPRADEDGARCTDCGSHINGFAYEVDTVTVLHPCEQAKG